MGTLKHTVQGVAAAAEWACAGLVVGWDCDVRDRLISE